MSQFGHFSLYKGCLTLRSAEIDAIATKWQQNCVQNSENKEKFCQACEQRLARDGERYHLTVISSEEMKKLSQEEVRATLHSLNISSSLSIFDLGVGTVQHQCYYVIIYAPLLQKTRNRFDLPPVDFHITLGFHHADCHDSRKGISTLWFHNGEEFIRKIERVLRAKSKPNVRNFLEYNRLAEMTLQEGYLFGAYYLAKYQNDTVVACDILEEAIVNDKKCRVLQPVQSDDEDYGELVCQALNFHLYAPQLYHHRLRRFYKSQVDVNKYEISYIEMPRNFSFVTDKVAGSSLPDTRKALENLVSIGITDVLTVMEGPLDNAQTSGLPLEFHWFEVKDRTPPSITQMEQMMEICDKPDRKILVHCLGGVGRTATVLASHLMWTTGASRQEAKQPLIDSRRTIISQSQDDFLSQWYSKCLDRVASTTMGQKVGEVPVKVNNAITVAHSSAKSKPNVKIKFPPLIMCVGYPASGKSTFTEALCSSNPERFIHINQDLAGRKECEANIGKYVKMAGKTVILDRCNLSGKERKEWKEMAHNKQAWVIFFSIPIEECKWRIVRRVGHPTLKTGGGARVIDSVAGTLEIPDPKSEGFEKFFEVDCFDSANALLSEWGCESEPVSTIPDELGLLKFPRTRHICNLGSATRDDLIIPLDDVKSTFLKRHIYVEEKIDGANMGLSIQNNKLVAQNRSHYVNAEYHPQFKFLDKWMYQNSAALWDILQTDRYILYGEWCYAKHSIPYDALSDWFTAFDMFDRMENKFWSRQRLEAHLEGTGIAVIPLIAEGIFQNVEELKKLVQTKSKYYEGPVEGIVARVNSDDSMFTESRGKIVRSDFLSGDTHWSKSSTKNSILRHDEKYK